jgi:hypothetical protein
MDSHIHANDDSVIIRNRTLRWLVVLITPIVTIYATYMAAMMIANVLRLPSIFGIVPGVAVGVYVYVGYLLPRCYVTNAAGSAFMTVDAIKGWLGQSPYVSYGPGLHPSYPWELREGKNNFSLEEVSQSASSRIILTDGDVNIDYGIRLRADITKLPKFLTGAASAASDLSEITNSTLIKELNGKTLNTALTSANALNEALQVVFAAKQSEFEERFGVIVGDITIGKILPSEDVMKTRSGKAEMQNLDEMVVASLMRLHGLKSKKAWAEAVKNGTITSAMIDDAMRTAKGATGNTDGTIINETRQRIDLSVSGISPEMAKAVAAIAPTLAKMAGGKKPSPAK